MKCYQATGNLFTKCGQKALMGDSSVADSQHFLLTAFEKEK